MHCIQYTVDLDELLFPIFNFNYSMSLEKAKYGVVHDDLTRALTRVYLSFLSFSFSFFFLSLSAPVALLSLFFLFVSLISLTFLSLFPLLSLVLPVSFPLCFAC